MLKTFYMTAANSAAADRLVTLLERVDARPVDLLRVLTYHRVADPAQTPNHYPRVTVTPEAFERQMHMVAEHYRVVSMEEVLQAAKTGSALPPGSVLITFDDATCDFAVNALPVLKRYHLPVTLFVPTAFPGHPERAFWWDQLYAAVEHAHRHEQIRTPVGNFAVQTPAQRKRAFSQLRDYVKSLPHGEAMDWIAHFCEEIEAPASAGDVLSWEDLRRIAREGVTLGPHTQTHPMMQHISSAEIRAEAVGSWQDLRREIGDTPPIFAYPGGGYNSEVLQILKDEGFLLAFTTQRGLNDFRRSDRLQLKRINVGPRTSLPLFRAQLLGWMKYLTRSAAQ